MFAVEVTKGNPCSLGYKVKPEGLEKTVSQNKENVN